LNPFHNIRHWMFREENAADAVHLYPRTLLRAIATGIL
jgi:hypothetical protein